MEEKYVGAKHKFDGVGFAYKYRCYIYAKSGYKCHYCSKHVNDMLPMERHIDHKFPRCKGGKDDEENLVLSCSHCNIQKGSMDDKTYKVYRDTVESDDYKYIMFAYKNYKELIKQIRNDKEFVNECIEMEEYYKNNPIVHTKGQW